MDAQPKVSVIISVYNTEAYLREAVESIINQSLKEIEIIIVNDGSTDGSASIIEELAAKDSRIITISQKNSGPSIARNNGLSHATGIYVYFMDSDDRLRNDALTMCYEMCKKKDLDFVFFEADIIDDHSWIIDYHFHTIAEDTIYNGYDLFNDLLDSSQLRVPVWLYFIRRQYLSDNKIGFYPHIIHEDELFIVLLFLSAKSVQCIHQNLFSRRVRSNSIMTTHLSWRNVEGYFTVFYELRKHSETMAISKKLTVRRYIAITLNAFLYNAHVMSVKDKVRTLKLILFGGWFEYVSLKVLARFIL